MASRAASITFVFDELNMLITTGKTPVVINTFGRMASIQIQALFSGLLMPGLLPGSLQTICSHIAAQVVLIFVHHRCFA